MNLLRLLDFSWEQTDKIPWSLRWGEVLILELLQLCSDLIAHLKYPAGWVFPTINSPFKKITLILCIQKYITSHQGCQKLSVSWTQIVTFSICFSYKMGGARVNLMVEGN